MAWTYATEQDVIDLIGQTALIQLSNVDNTGSTVDSDRVTRAGESADAWINARLKRLGYTTPLAGTDANTDRMMADLSARMVVLELRRARSLISVGNDKTGNSLQRSLDAMRDEVLAVFRNIGAGATPIVADRDYAPVAAAEVYEPEDTITIVIS